MIKVDKENITISGNRIVVSAELIILFRAMMRENLLSAEVIKSILDYAESPEKNPVPIVKSLIKMGDDIKKED